MSYKRIQHLPIFQKYKEIHGNLFVPPTYVVPQTEPWPESSFDLKLGRYINHIRNQFKKDEHYYDRADMQFLNKLGMCWNVSNYNSNIILLAAQTYQLLHGPISNMRYNFMVPRGDVNWPEITWGLKLHSKLQNIKHTHLHQIIHKELIEMGLVFHPKVDILANISDIPHDNIDNVQNENDQTTEAINGLPTENSLEDMAVPQEEEDEAPRKRRRGPLGREPRKKIEHIPLIRIYNEIHGDCMVPANFVVPRDDPRWPAEHVGFSLGHYVKKLRPSVKLTGLYFPEDVRALTQIGFVWDLMQHKAECVLLALQTYKALHKNLNIPLVFVVPFGDPAWPKITWGVKLGNALSNIRYNNSYSHIRPSLVELGVVFAPTVESMKRARQEDLAVLASDAAILTNIHILDLNNVAVNDSDSETEP